MTVIRIWLVQWHKRNNDHTSHPNRASRASRASRRQSRQPASADAKREAPREAARGSRAAKRRRLVSVDTARNDSDALLGDGYEHHDVRTRAAKRAAHVCGACHQGGHVEGDLVCPFCLAPADMVSHVLGDDRLSPIPLKACGTQGADSEKGIGDSGLGLNALVG